MSLLRQVLLPALMQYSTTCVIQGMVFSFPVLTGVGFSTKICGKLLLITLRRWL
jgi:hypothetical protein